MSNTDSLESLGFGPTFTAQRALLDRPDLVPARIAGESPGCYHLLGCAARLGELSGRLHRDLDELARPAVGDWVAVAERGSDRAIVHHVFDRRTAMVRRAAGRTGAPQIVAANVDTFFVVTSANLELNRRRLERYLSAVWDSGAAPVVILNKIDLAGPGEIEGMVAAVADVGPAVPLLPISAATGAGLDALRAQVGAGRTAGFIGSSGVGKSSLINCLVGRDLLRAAPIGGEDRGRHTTTRRELIVTAEAGLLMDTPGMRELGLFDDQGGLDATFADIAALAGSCRFRDCRHQGESGCAVEAAVGSGELDAGRLAAYRKLLRELAFGERRRERAAVRERRRWKAVRIQSRRRSKIDPKQER